MTQVVWANGASGTKKLHYDDLALGESFVIKSRGSKGAVYRKVYTRGDGAYYMEELATAKLFQPTLSEVELVKVKIDIDAPKPIIYS